MSIELPVTSRHRRDMTERLLKATLSPNQTNLPQYRASNGVLIDEQFLSLLFLDPEFVCVCVSVCVCRWGGEGGERVSVCVCGGGGGVDERRCGRGMGMVTN